MDRLKHVYNSFTQSQLLRQYGVSDQEMNGGRGEHDQPSVICIISGFVARKLTREQHVHA